MISRIASENGILTTVAEAEAEIRLLKLKPEISGLEDDIVCELNHESLAGPPAYVALSYNWGNPTVTKNITVSGKTVSITYNLDLALRHLRRAGHLLVWADALCINQSDLDERSIQVQRMLAVYGRAEKVVAWLGTHEDRSEDVLSFLMQYQRRGYLDGIADVPWGSIDLFFQRPYWERAWIVQELSVADQLQVMCGPKLCDFKSLEWLSTKLAANPMAGKTIGRSANFQHFRQLCQIRDSVQKFEPIAMMELLSRTRRVKATDIRDKIFALISLSFDGRFLLPVPNYRSSPDEINFEISAALIRKRKSYDLAVLLARTLHSQDHHDTRKWYPDWFCGDTWSERRKIEYLRLQTVAKSDYIDALRPSARYMHPMNLFSNPLLKPDCLITRAIIIGEIEEISSTLQEAPKLQPLALSTPPEINDVTDGWSRTRKDHYLPRIEYREEKAVVVFRLLTLYSKAAEDQLRTIYPEFGATEALEDQLLNDFYDFFTRSALNSPGQAQSQRIKNWNSSWRRNFDPLVAWASSNSGFRVGLNLSLSEVLCSLRPNLLDPHSPAPGWLFNRTMETLRTGKRIARTTSNHFGWVPQWSTAKDQLALLQGCSVPVILRRRPSGGYWIVGESHFLDLMDGVVSNDNSPYIKTWSLLEFY